MKTQKATLPSTIVHNARNLWGDKIPLDCYHVCAIHNNEIKTYVTAHTYISKSTGHSGTVYASIWVSNHTSGHGKASGYGYHKASAALQAAIDSAGITLDHPIDGRGNSPATDALIAIAIVAGADPLTVQVI